MSFPPASFASQNASNTINQFKCGGNFHDCQKRKKKRKKFTCDVCVYTWILLKDKLIPKIWAFEPCPIGF